MNTQHAIHAIESNLEAKTLYGADMIVRDDHVRWFRAGNKAGVVWAHFTEAMLDDQIDQTLIMLGDLPLTWWVGAYSQPVGLGRALQQHGLWHNRDMMGMAALMADLPKPEPLDASLRFERVRDDATLHHWQTIVTHGFRMNPAAAQASYDQFRQLGYADDVAWQHFVIRDEREVVATSSLFLSDNVAGLYNIGTAPAMRQRGLGRLITLLTFATAQPNYKIATLQTTFPNALRLYQRMGFEVYCKIGIYQK